MTLAAALIYWMIVCLWASVLATVCVAYVRNPRIFGTARLLLLVILIDSTRNIVENLYFGMYFGSQYGLFPASVALVLSSPGYLILPKVMNVVAGSAVLGLLLLRWLPSASKERENADATLKIRETALQHEMEERQRLTFYDHLTGLPNRASLGRDLAGLLKSRAGEQISGLTLAVVDLDRFKDSMTRLGIRLATNCCVRSRCGFRALRPEAGCTGSRKTSLSFCTAPALIHW